MAKFILIVLLPILGWSGEPSPSISTITSAIQEGDAATLGAYFDQSVELAVLNKAANCDPKQAVKMVDAFFQKYQPKAFQQVHQGKSAENKTSYCIGNLTTSNNIFRVYIYLHDTKNRIQELRFEQE